MTVARSKQLKASASAANRSSDGADGAVSSMLTRAMPRSFAMRLLLTALLLLVLELVGTSFIILKVPCKYHIKVE